MSDREDFPTGIQSSRRHLVKIGAIAVSAILASLTQSRLAAAAGNGNGQGGNGQGGNGQGGNGQGGNGQGGNGQGGNGQGGNGGGGNRHVSCFLKGTTIRTTEGHSKVEDLAVGDLLPTAFGGIRRIQWIGRYRFKKSDPAKAWVKDVLPVRVRRSALGPDVPCADLYVTKPHALLIDGILVPVCNLINGTTITVYEAGELDELEFFHIKLEVHDVIYAEGAPCETLVCVDENAVNFAEYLRRYGPRMAEEARCAPWVGFGRRIEIRSHLRSAISPWIDRRQKLDIIRDKLDQRGVALLQRSELA